MINIKDDYILGWQVPISEEEANELKVITIENHFDKYRNPQWKWIDNKAVFSPQSLTAEQVESEREANIEKEIPFTIQQEIALIKKGIEDKTNTDYVNYKDIVDNIKAKYPKE